MEKFIIFEVWVARFNGIYGSDDQEKRAQGCFAVRFAKTSLRIYYEDRSICFIDCGYIGCGHTSNVALIGNLCLLFLSGKMIFFYRLIIENVLG